MDKDNERILLANVIGECIKSLQLDKNINQKELALLSGVSERSLRRIERGQVNVNVYVLRQLVMALGEEMPDFWRIVEKNMELMGEEFPHVRKRVADKVLRDNKNNKWEEGCTGKFYLQRRQVFLFAGIKYMSGFLAFKTNLH